MTEPKLCECGCGQATAICAYTLRKKGYIKGEPLRFVRGHQNRGRRWTEGQGAAFRKSMTGRKPPPEVGRKISATLKERGIRPSPEAAAKGNQNRPKGENNPGWKGGVRMMANGYRQIYAPDHPRRGAGRYVYEHILVAERTLGRFLVSGEVVHHIDGNKLNNHPDNLRVFASQAEHIRFHRAEEQRGDAGNCEDA